MISTELERISSIRTALLVPQQILTSDSLAVAAMAQNPRMHEDYQIGIICAFAGRDTSEVEEG